MFDQPHLVTALASVPLGRHWRLGGKVRFASGNPYTPVAGTYFNGDEQEFSWWSNFRNDFEKNRGLRIDHIWASPGVGRAATAFEVVEDARLWGKPSDHVPVVVEFDG